MSALAVVELHSVLARLVRTGEITLAEFHAARGRFLADLAAGLWQGVQVTDVHFLQAQQLLVQYGPVHSLRTLDALQLSVALGLRAVGSLDDFVCADMDLGQVAAAEGLVVINPEAP